MEFRKSVDHDVPKIFDKLSERLGDEYLASQRYLHDPNCDRRSAFLKTKRGFREAIRENRSDTLLHQAGPIGMVKRLFEGQELHTGFAARDDFFKARFVRLMKRYVTDLQKRYPEHLIVSTNWSGRSDVRPWFEALGYVFHSDHGPAKVFYVPNPRVLLSSTGGSPQ